MKIVIISTAYPLRGGIAQYTGILYHKLKERNHQVHVLTFKRQYPGIFFPGKTQLDTSSDESVRIASEPIIDSIGPWSWWKAFRRVKQLQPDLILFKYWMPFFAPCFGSIASLCKRFTDAKILYLCDNIIPHERRPGDVLLTRYALRHADSFIVQSEAVRQELLQLFPNARHKVVPHPVYDIFGPTLDKKRAKARLGLQADKVLLFFGYVRRYKGLDVLLHAMPDILRQVEVKLLVVGEFYENEAEFRKLIANLKIAEKVDVVAEFVPNEEVGLYFCAADVVVLPYKSATQSGIVQLAYHFDKPSIVTDVGGLAEVVLHEETGLVVPPNNPQELARAVVRFYAEDLELRFSKNISREKKKYSWESMIDAIEGSLQ